jgi:hypothetical protein
MSLIGEGGIVADTPAQRERAANGFVDAYRREKVPALYEHYIRNGEPEKAEAFMAWTESRGVREGMKGWAGALRAMSVNDMDGVIDGLAAAFNAPDYYDDGYEVIRSKSGLTERGLEITFKGPDGREFTTTIDSTDDLMAIGVGMLAPEAAFEKGWEFIKERNRAQGQQRPMSGTEARAIQKMIDDRAMVDPDFAAMAPEQQRQAVIGEMQEIQRMGTGTGLGAGVQDEPPPVYGG